MPKIVDHNAYRNDIIQTVASLFAEHGYAALGMRDIAKALGVSKGTLYHYFPNKEALFQAVCEAVVQLDLAVFAAYHEQAGATTLRERVRTVLRYCAEQEAWLMQQYLVLMEYVRVNGPNELRQNRIIQAATDEYVTAIAQYLGTSDHTAVTAFFVFLTGLIFQRFFDGGATNFDAMAEWFSAVLSASLARADSAG
jgi:AcrR family transcriptional regulator